MAKESRKGDGQEFITSKKDNYKKHKGASKKMSHKSEKMEHGRKKK